MSSSSEHNPWRCATERNVPPCLLPPREGGLLPPPFPPDPAVPPFPLSSSELSEASDSTRLIPLGSSIVFHGDGRTASMLMRLPSLTGLRSKPPMLSMCFDMSSTDGGRRIFATPPRNRTLPSPISRISW